MKSYKKFESNQTDRKGSGEEMAQREMWYSITCTIIQQTFTEQVLCAVNRRYGSASRSALFSGDRRPDKHIISTQYCKHNNRGTHRFLGALRKGFPSRFLPSLIEVSFHLETPAALLWGIAWVASIHSDSVIWFSELPFRVSALYSAIPHPWLCLP